MLLKNWYRIYFCILSAIMNNMPTIMVMDIALQDIPNQALAYANIIGCNLGPKMDTIW